GARRCKNGDGETRSARRVARISAAAHRRPAGGARSRRSQRGRRRVRFHRRAFGLRQDNFSLCRRWPPACDGRAHRRGWGRGDAVVFEDASLLPWRTVLKNVLYGLECIGVARREAYERARHFIALVGLSGFEQNYPYELSGGMQQRVNLARALVIDPKILLMDEPFASLDAQTRESMQVELLRIWKEAGKTVLFVTHQIDKAIFLSDRVIVFSARPGRVKENIPIDIERPRTLHLKREARFHALEDRIWRLIHDGN